MSRPVLFTAAGVLLLLLVAAIVWLLGQDGGGRRGYAPRGWATASNAALDIRYSYDPVQLAPPPYVPNAEFPLRLEGPQFSFFGKRIQGAGGLLAKQPGSLLYDFVGSQQDDVLRTWYRLEVEGEPVYEDMTVNGRLGLHTRTHYRLTDRSRGWPEFFPDSITGGGAAAPADEAFVDGWALFTDADLFYFYAVSAAPLDAERAATCQRIIESIQFGALGGAGTAPAESGEEGAEDAGEPDDWVEIPLDRR